MRITRLEKDENMKKTGFLPQRLPLKNLGQKKGYFLFSLA